ncbi:MAG: DUF6152 family protein [Pseudomonadota bacterium]|nr:DUF6152 family protein [Pseudomonadota bacterium]
MFVYSLVVSAHHAATGRYEPDLFGVTEGVITDVFWRNPHVRLLIAVEGDDGQVDEWEVDFGSVNTVQRLGVSRDKVTVGERVSVYGRLGRDGLTVMFADSIVLPDGEEVELQGGVRQRYGLTDEALSDARSEAQELRSDIFRVWLPLVRPRTGYIELSYPLTAAGRAIQAQWDPEQDPALRCIPPGMPTVMDNPYPVEFRDEGDTIVMLLEEWDGVRTIYMNGTGEPAQPRMGRSVGRWEAGTLVVRTTDINWRYVDDRGTPQSEGVVVDERFSLNEDGTELHWEARITDPENFTEPLAQRIVWTWVPGHEIKPFDCALPE